MQQEAQQYHLGNQQSQSYPKLLCDSDDMIAILNARGTVLLNMYFSHTLEQLHIVKLASLAVGLWAQRPVDINEERYRVIHCMILLIRDDIQQHLLSAVNNFDVNALLEQHRHIEILTESVATWRNMVSRSWGLRTNKNSDTQLELLRRDCEAALAADIRSREIAQNVHSTYNRVEDHASEYLGPLLRDEKDQEFVDEISFPGLQRRDGGYWLQV
jgi:hypothetical protein